ncbi:MAG: transcriptional regulator [Bdellovibrionales bacterium]
MEHVNKQLNVELINLRLSELGLSVPKLAEAIDVSREIVYKWLDKEKFPRPANLLQLTRILKVAYKEMVLQDLSSEPVIAFRKKAHAKTTDEHLTRAVNMGKALEPLIPYMPFDSLSRPATLLEPKVEYAYVQQVALDTRKQLRLNGEAVEFESLIGLFNNLHAVLIPVLWGAKKNHENALHIHLPKSMTTWIYLNLDTHIHDFKFWMAHELGHVKAPELRGDDGEDFADAFAAALLFPEHLAKSEYEALSRLPSDGHRVNRIKQIANHHVISLFTVLGEVNKYAGAHSLPQIKLNIAPANTLFNKQFPLISEVLLKSKQPTPEVYIEVAKKFNSPFFDGLKNYLIEHKKSASMISRVLNMPILDAQAIYEDLTGGAE